MGRATVTLMRIVKAVLNVGPTIATRVHTLHFLIRMIAAKPNMCNTIEMFILPGIDFKLKGKFFNPFSFLCLLALYCIVLFLDGIQYRSWKMHE